MKNHYSQYPIGGWRDLIKEHIDGVDLDTIRCRFSPTQDGVQAYNEFYTLLKISKGEATHLYIESFELAEWLLSEGAKGHVRWLLPLIMNGTFNSEVIVVNPVSCFGPSVAFTASKEGESIWWRASSRKTGGKHAGGNVCVDERKLTSRAKSLHEEYEPALMLGVALYISAYPHALVPGIPENAKHKKRFPEGALTIRATSESRQHIAHGSPIPHPRLEHNVTYQHPRYVQARGDTRPRRGSNVRGFDPSKQFTVVDVEGRLNPAAA